MTGWLAEMRGGTGSEREARGGAGAEAGRAARGGARLLVALKVEQQPRDVLVLVRGRAHVRDDAPAELLDLVGEQRAAHRRDLAEVLAALVRGTSVLQRHARRIEPLLVDAPLEQADLRRPRRLYHRVVVALRLDELLQAAVVELVLVKEEVVQHLRVKVLDGRRRRAGPSALVL